MKQLCFVISVLFISSFFISGCSTMNYNYKVAEIGDYPQPLIKPLSLRVGVYHNEDFRKFETVDKTILADMPIIQNIQMGEANIALFDYILHTYFEEIITVQKFPEDIERIASVDIIMEPNVQGYYCFIGSDLWSVVIDYEIKFYLPNGDPIGSWEIKGSGSYQSRIMSFEKWTKEATKHAMREVVAKFMTDFCNQAFIKKVSVNVCKKAQVKVPLTEPSHTNQSNVFAILGENEFAECVENELAENMNKLRIIPEDDFRDALFPWFEPNTVPNRIEDLDSMMNQTQVFDRIRSMGIRYIIFVRGYKLKGKSERYMLESYYGVFGYMSKDVETGITTVIWDLEKRVTLEDIQVEKSGSVKYIGLIFPIPSPDGTKSTACRETAKRILNHLTSKDSHTEKSNNQ